MNAPHLQAATPAPPSARKRRRKVSRARLAVVPPVLDDGPRAYGVVEQVKIAFHPKNRVAAVLGFLWGGSVPLGVYMVSHYAIDPSRPLPEQWFTYLVLGGLIFSALTVYQWSKLAFDSGLKAFGFVVFIEGVMTTVPIPWLALSELVLLVLINGTAIACNLTKRRTE